MEKQSDEREHPWNRHRDEHGNIIDHENIYRVYSWTEIVAKIRGVLEEHREKIDKDSSVLRIWEESIRVQMYFNEMIMRNRITFASIVFAAFGAVLALQKLNSPSASSISGITSIILIITAIGILSYGWVDMRYYFKLLVGAVDFTEQMDRKYKGLGLTSSITKQIGHKGAKRTLYIYYAIIIVGLVITWIFKSKL